MLEDVKKRVCMLRAFGVQPGSLQDRGCHPGVAQNGQKGVSIHHVVVLRVSESKLIFLILQQNMADTFKTEFLKTRFQKKKIRLQYLVK
jgi:hypothetical protein